jgi:ABC-type Mn2+/Zn2+ transport system ATPase subunit
MIPRHSLGYVIQTTHQKSTNPVRVYRVLNLQAGPDLTLTIRLLTPETARSVF